jgi:hypothetical protein
MANGNNGGKPWLSNGFSPLFLGSAMGAGLTEFSQIAHGLLRFADLSSGHDNTRRQLELVSARSPRLN